MLKINERQVGAPLPQDGLNVVPGPGTLDHEQAMVQGELYQVHDHLVVVQHHGTVDPTLGGTAAGRMALIGHDVLLTLALRGNNEIRQIRAILDMKERVAIAVLDAHLEPARPGRGPQRLRGRSLGPGCRSAGPGQGRIVALTQDITVP